MAAAFEGWAKIELFGHRVLFGHVSEVTMFGARFARIEVPTEPPTVEFKSAQAIYGIAPRTEEECRKQNEPWKPRPALSSPEDADLVEDDGSKPVAITVCGYCGLPVDEGEDAEDVALDDGSEREVWHKRCAEEHAEPLDPEPGDPVDSDAPLPPRNPAMDPINPELGMGET